MEVLELIKLQVDNIAYDIRNLEPEEKFTALKYIEEILFNGDSKSKNVRDSDCNEENFNRDRSPKTAKIELEDEEEEQSMEITYSEEYNRLEELSTQEKSKKEDIEEDCNPQEQSHLDKNPLPQPFENPREAHNIFHTTTFSNSKIPTCKDCNKMFPSLGCLFDHTRKMHAKSNISNVEGSYSYSCPQCDYKSKWKANLTTHMGKHTGEFDCNYCNVKIGSKKSQKVHQKSVKHMKHMQELFLLLK